MKKYSLCTSIILIPIILSLILSCDLFFPASEGVLPDPTPSPTPMPALTIVPTPTHPPDGNMIYNHDFSNGLDNWNLLVNEAGGAEAYATTVAEVAAINITQELDNFSDIQFIQKYLHIVENKTYRLIFHIRGEDERYLYVEIGEDNYDNNNDGNKYTSYGGQTIHLISSTQMAIYYVQINMTHPTDTEARLVFNLGKYNEDVYIDNVTLVELP